MKFHDGVIPKARVCTSGARDLLRNCSVRGDPSLRLKNGFAQDDAIKVTMQEAVQRSKYKIKD